MKCLNCKKNIDYILNFNNMAKEYIRCECGCKMIVELNTKSYKYKSITSMVLKRYITNNKN